MKKDFLNKIFDQVLEEASSIYVENEEKKNIEVNDAEFSDIHKQKMQKLFKEAKRAENRKKAVKITKKVAIVILCTLVITTGLITSVEAWREEVVKFIMKNNDNNYMSIQFGDNRYELSGDIYESGDIKENNQYITDEIKFLYLPEGFEFEKKEKKEHATYYSFINLNNFVRLKKEDFNKNYLKEPDIENSITEKYELGQKEIFKVEKETGRVNYMWYDEQYSYGVVSNLEEKEIFKFIENIKILKDF